MTEAIVNRIIPFSSVDGPGNRTAVFLQGCGFSCKYCHNPETIRRCGNCGRCVEFCRTGALSFINGRVHYDREKCVLCDACIHNCKNLSSPRTTVMTADEVIACVKKNMPFIRGITVSGGECTEWRDFLVELLGKASGLGLGTLLDSNGSYDFSTDPELLALTDGVMLDVKAWNREEHLAITGQDNSMVLGNLNFLLSVGKLSEVRVVVVPGLMNADETVGNVSRVLREHGRTDIRMKIIKFRANGVRAEYKGLVPPSDEYLASLKKLAQASGLTDVVLI